MKLLAGLARFLGQLLAPIFVALLREGKKPRKTEVHGNDADLQDSINDSIDDQISSSASGGGDNDK